MHFELLCYVVTSKFFYIFLKMTDFPKPISIVACPNNHWRHVTLGLVLSYLLFNLDCTLDDDIVAIYVVVSLPENDFTRRFLNM